MNRRRLNAIGWCMLAAAALAGCNGGMFSRNGSGCADGCTAAGCTAAGCTANGCTANGCTANGCTADNGTANNSCNGGSCQGGQCQCQGGQCQCQGGQCQGGQCDPGLCGPGSCCSHLCGCWTGFCTGHSLAVPDVQPLGSVVRAHYHTMQANGEAADFILHRNDFIGNTAELSPAGKDHILEIGARMRSAPFPVIVERSEHNADPELDAHRREIVARVLADLGNVDAHQRVFVSQPYGRALNSQEAEFDYYRFLYTRGGFGNFGNNFGGGGGGVGIGGFGF